MKIFRKLQSEKPVNKAFNTCTYMSSLQILYSISPDLESPACGDQDLGIFNKSSRFFCIYVLFHLK